MLGFGTESAKAVRVGGVTERVVLNVERG